MSVKATNQDISLDYIIDQTMEAAPEYRNLIDEYTANMYIKGYINIKKSNILINYVPTMFKLKKGVKEYITESYSELHYTSPNIFDRKITTHHGTIDKIKNFNAGVLDYFDINIYSNSMFGVKLLSPLSHKAKKFYNYKIDSIYNDEYGKRLYRILFTPKYSSYQLVNGYMDVYDDTWKIYKFQFSGRSEYLNYTNKIKMGQDSALSEEILPLEFDTNMSFNLLGNVFEGNFTVNMDYETIKLQEKEEVRKDKKNRYDLTRSFTLGSDTSSITISDSSYFAQFRPFPLSEKEQSIYEKYYAENENKNANNKEKEHENMFWGNIGDALVGSTQLGGVRFSPLLNPLMLSYNAKDGISYKQRIRYQRVFGNNSLLDITPMGGYNFKFNEFYWNIPVTFEYMPAKRGSFTFDIGNGNRIYSSEILDELKTIPDSTFDFNNIHLDYFHDFYVNISHSVEVLNGLSVDAGISIHRRSAIEKYDFGKQIGRAHV